MRIRSAFLLVLFLVLVAGNASAQYPVYFYHSGEDSIGRRIAYNIEKEIAGASVFKQADIFEPHWSVYLVTLESGDYSSAFSLVFTACPVLSPDRSQEFYITQIVGICGFDRVSICAENISASMVRVFKDYVNDGRLDGMARIIEAVNAGLEFDDFKTSLPRDRVLFETSDTSQR